MGAPALWIELLGNPRVRVRGEPAELPGSRKTRALLGYLLLQRRPVTRSHLCELLWPTPDDPRAALRWSLSKLRPLLDHDGTHLQADRTTVRISGLEACVDLCTLESLLRGPIAAVATDALESAAAMFQGELLEGHELSDCFAFYDWLQARREAVRQSQRKVLRELVNRYEQAPERALPSARGLVALDPLEESNHALVVRLLRRLRRHGDARRQVEHYRHLLESELNQSPSAEFLRLASAAPREATPRDGGTRRSPAPPVPPDGRSAALAGTVAAEPEGLFGRGEECALLEEFLAEIGGTGSPPVLLLEGEPGIGKTRLLEELSRRCASRPVRILACRSWEAEMVRPFAAWLDLLADVPPARIPPELRPDLTHLMSGRASLEGAPLDEARVFRATAALLGHLAPEGGGLLLVFDDLQWMDASSGALLNFVTRSARGRLAVACAGRPGEFADSTAARALLRSWARSGALRRLAVGPLGDRDAAALARCIGNASDVAEIVDRCGGNPFYLIALARAGGAGVPEHVQQVLADRLRSLDEEALACARWIAVFGRETPAGWLEELTSLDTHELTRAMAELRGAGILAVHETSCDFAHDLLRQAVLSQLPGAQRALMHRHVARVLRAKDDESGCLAADIAYHAARGGDVRLAARAAVAAGERALRLAARDEAYALAQRGLRDLDRAEAVAVRSAAPSVPGDGQQGTVRERDLSTRAALLRILVHAGLGRRDVGFLREELTSLAEAAEGAGARAEERSAHYLLSVIAEEAGDFDGARRHSLQAERVGRSADDETRLAALANTARCLVQLERDPKRARTLLGEAERLADELRARVLDIPWGRGLLSALEGDDDAARAALEQGVRIARERENHWAEYECLAGLSRLDLEAGRWDGVLGRDAALRQAAARLGEGSDLPFAGALRALAVAARDETGAPGPDGERDEPLEHALEALRAADTKGRLAYALNVAAEIDLRRGTLDRAIERASEARTAAAAVGRPVQMARASAVRGLAELARGNVEAAEAQRRQVEEDFVRLGPNVGARAQLMRLVRALDGGGPGAGTGDRPALDAR